MSLRHRTHHGRSFYPNGGRFCIDRTEVTRGHYALFLAAKEKDLSGQAPECAKNTSFQPLLEQASPDVPEGATCTDYTPLQPKQPKAPMVCVDWCDAKAYCAWAGKRLCGKIGGGQLSMAGWEDASKLEGTNSTISEWGFACSQGAQTSYPYGTEHQDGVCVDETYKAQKGLGQYSPVDVGTDPACHGQSPPYDGVWDMVGSVGEFEDGFTEPNLIAVRVGYNALKFDCTTVGAVTENFVNPEIGFRCCAD